MSNFKNIEKLGLSITTWGGDPRTSAVLAQELETLLQSAQVVYGPDKRYWNDMKEAGDNYSAILMAITPLKKKTKAEAALEFIREIEQLGNAYFRDKAKKILEMKDGV